MIGAELAEDLLESVATALRLQAVFPEGDKLVAIFRNAIVEAITNIEERSALLRRFLRHGPHVDGEEPARGPDDPRLTDDETSSVITFVYSHIVNCFQGRLAELLASGPCAQLLRDHVTAGCFPASARLYVGDSVMLSDESKRVRRKAADMHIMSREAGAGRIVHGVVEVKSYSPGMKRLWSQLARHVYRIRTNAKVTVREDGARSVVPASCAETVIAVAVTPATWKIPRTFSLVPHGDGTRLEVDPPVPPTKEASVSQEGLDRWRIVLPWSREALAAAAYEMTFWYMEKLGEVIYTDGVPQEWGGTTPAEAGRNAAKMMLYYAMLRPLGRRAEQRAIALYNTYGFGYALGMNFRGARGRRQLLWPEDLREIAEHGSTKEGCRVRS